MKKKKLVIVGSGISGLTCGIFALQKGYDVDIYEKNSYFGGCCSSYTKDGFLVDHCLHWIIGTKKGTPDYKNWLSIGAFNENTKIISLGDVVTINYQNQIYRIQRDYKATIKEWLLQSPEDKDAILEVEKHFSSIHFYISKINKASDKNNKEKHSLSTLIKCLNLTREEVANKFKNEGLKRLILNAQNGENCWLFFLLEYGHIMNENANIPEGGSLQFISNICEKYLRFGGKLYKNSEIVDVIVLKNNIEKIILKDGQEIKADKYVFAIPPDYLYTTLLKEKFSSKKIKKLVENKNNEKMPSCVQANFVSSLDLSSWPVPLGIEVEKPIKVGVHNINTIMIRHFFYDKKTFEKDGSAVVAAFIDQNNDDYEYFFSLSESDYIKEKDRIQNEIYEVLINYEPKLKGAIKKLDIFTPLTLQKYLFAPYGSYMSYSLNKHTINCFYKTKNPKIKNMLLANGRCILTSGTPFAFKAGKNAAKKL